MIQLHIKGYFVSSNCKIDTTFFENQILYSIKNIEELEKLNDLVSSQNQVNLVRLQDKLGKQKIRENIKEVFEPVIITIKNTHENSTMSLTEPSIKNNQALEALNNKLLEIMNYRCILAIYLMSPLSKITNVENFSQFRLIKDPNSIRVNDLIIDITIPVTLYNNLLTFRDKGEEFEIKGDLLEMITNKNYNVDLASLSDKKLLYDWQSKCVLI